ncbi:MAG: DUF1549 domain-containing protein, partial [Gemmataceae bacterium]
MRASLWLILFGSSTAISAPPDFDREVAPILAEHCFSCHTGPKPKGDLDLSSKAKVLASGQIVPGNAAKSELWDQIDSNAMPPKKPLPTAARQTIRAWIDAGAVWGTDPIDPFRFSTATRAGTDWWSLQPLTKSIVPNVGVDPGWAKSPIDRFLFEKLQKKGLKPSPPGTRRVLIRRLAMDLTGLPPTPEEVTAFENDPDPQAYTRLVDRLLASPHYGERWARHWLDVVRYGESQGFERNDPRLTAWPYRDWVIRALNADMPFDRFTQMQIAGDALFPKDPDGDAALGYLVAGVHNTVLPIQEAARLAARQDELEDIVGNVAQTFLGLSAQCARCHDHKFDAISQTDYYRLAATVAGVQHSEKTITNRVDSEQLAVLSTVRQSTQKELMAIEETARKLAENALPPGPKPPAAILEWNFRQATGQPPLKLHGGAKLTPAGLVLDGKTGYASSEPLPIEVRTKTLHVRLKLDTLTQRGGGVMSLQSRDGAVFDAIVFGEQEPKRWLAGSDFFRRTRTFQGVDESSTESVQFTIVHSAEGTITGYRNGEPYGQSYKTPNVQTLAAGQGELLFGLRHTPAGGNRHFAGTV